MFLVRHTGWILLNLKLQRPSGHFSLLMAVDQQANKADFYIGGGKLTLITMKRYELFLHNGNREEYV